MNNQREIDRYEVMERAIDEEIEQAQQTLDYAENEEDYKKMQLLWQKQEDIRELKEKYIAETLNITAMQTYYMMTGDKTIFDVAEVLKQVYTFFEKNTDIPIEKIIETINDNIYSIDIIEETERNAIASYGAKTKTLTISPEVIYSGKLKTTLQHEFTHLLGTKIMKNKTISGYDISDSPEMTNKLEKINKNPISRLIRKIFYKEQDNNVQFNEACVEIFANQDEKFEEYEAGNAKIYTNIISGYRYNANLVRQMLLARGTSEKEMFNGLFDYKKANKLIGKFNKKIFRELSDGMNETFELLNQKRGMWSKFDKKIDELNIANITSQDELNKIIEENTELKEIKRNILKNGDTMENKISTMEKMIIDKILLPRLSKINEDEKRNLLVEYSKFLMLSKDYLQEKTGIKIIDKNPNNERERFIQGLQVEPTSENDKAKPEKTLNETVQVLEDR